MSETTGPALDPAALRTFATALSRTALAARLGSGFGGRRDTHAVLGYTPELTYLDFKARYLRQHLAQRLVRIAPEATWAQPPSVDDDAPSDGATPFRAAWQQLATRLQVFARLEQADTLAVLGRYSVLLLGLRGQGDLATPAQPVRGPDDVLYLTPYSEEWATVATLETDAGSPTFGQPLTYRLDTSRGRGSAAGRTVVVHASRVVHVVVERLDDDVYGLPALEKVYDLLDDLYKVVGGSAEMFFRDAKRRIALETREGYHLDAAAEAAFLEKVDEYLYGMKDFLRVEGVDIKDMAGTVASPKDHVDVILSLIAASFAVPRRLLEGSERGELASSQDEAAWLGRITRRQVQIAEPRVLRPLLDRLVLLGVLPQPAQPYVVSWGNLLSLSEDQQATIALKVAQAASAFAGAGLASTLIPESEFRSVYLGLSEVPDVAPLDVAPGEDAL
jgi:hypothetical protein